MDLTGIGPVFDFAKGILDRFWPKQASEQEKLAALNQLVPMLQERENAVIEAQKSIIVAEMTQSDNFTKRARPMVVYAGLVFIALIYVILPFVSWTTKNTVPTIVLPDEFWWSWSSMVGIWAIGRTFEKQGATNKIISMVTGSK